MEQDTYNFLLAEAANKYQSSSFEYGAGAFAQIAGSYIDYEALKTQRAQYALQAQNVELNALERANMLHQQLVEAYGNYTANAAARGVRVSSGSVQDNLINSSMEFGKDISTLKKNAALKASSIRNLAKIDGIRSKVGLVNNVVGSVSNISKAYDNYQTYTKLKG